jgi:uncharacterized protein YyaL (SSP411 family)
MAETMSTRRNLRSHLRLRPWAPLAALSLAACAVPGAAAPRVTTSSAVSEGAPRAPLAWADFTPATFARARSEGKFIILDGAAEWCHWCHVMEATTYHDKTVAELIASRFIAVKVDVDSRPDIAERYGDWGWPATVIFSPDAQELGKYRGYIAPGDFAAILRDVIAGATASGPKIKMTPLISDKARLSDEELSFIERSTEVALDDYYDEEEAGWGKAQKAAIASDNAWALFRGATGDTVMRERILATLEKQKAILDPVWGGIYQYSVGRDWKHPHFEKLMPFQAGAIDNYARGFVLSRDRRLLDVAQSVRHYVDAFLTSKDGGFYATQDADVNSHDPAKPFLSGQEYYALGNAERRAKGMPRIDTHEYGRENGLAIAAYVTLYEATCMADTPLSKVGHGAAACDASVINTAERAAARIAATHTTSRGSIAHDADPAAHVVHLADNAAFGYALLRLYQATRNVQYRDDAQKIANVMLSDFIDTESGGFFASTIDRDAVGVFAHRRIPFEDNVTAIRVLAELGRNGDELDRAADAAAAERALQAIARPEAIRGQGRMIGDFLLAIEDLKALRRP